MHRRNAIIKQKGTNNMLHLKADIFCDHKNCHNSTTSDDVSSFIASFYGNNCVINCANELNEADWTIVDDDYEGSKYFCPTHKPKNYK